MRIYRGSKSRCVDLRIWLRAGHNRRDAAKRGN